jgi:hypothetical protein
MAAKTQRADKKKQKEQREKIILAALIVIFVIVGAIMVPKVLKKPGSPTASPSTTSTSTTTTGTTTTGTAVPTNGAALESAAYAPGEGQIAKLTRFSQQNPFAPPIGSQTTENGSGTTPAATTSATTTTSQAPPTTTSGPPEPYLSATIVVNGEPEEVGVGAYFPAASPVFVLKSVAAKSIKIVVAGGSFANGAATLTIRKGQTVTLVNTADGTRYTLKLKATSTKAPDTSTSTTGTSVGPEAPLPPTTGSVETTTSG